MSIRALSVMENLSDRFNPRVCFPLVKMFHATLKNTMPYIKMDCLNDRITIPQKTTTQQFGFLLTSERSLCMLVMNFSRSVAASTFAPIRSTSRCKKSGFSGSRRSRWSPGRWARCWGWWRSAWSALWLVGRVRGACAPERGKYELAIPTKNPNSPYRDAAQSSWQDWFCKGHWSCRSATVGLVSKIFPPLHLVLFALAVPPEHGHGALRGSDLTPGGKEEGHHRRKSLRTFLFAPKG